MSAADAGLANEDREGGSDDDNNVYDLSKNGQTPRKSRRCASSAAGSSKKKVPGEDEAGEDEECVADGPALSTVVCGVCGEVITDIAQLILQGSVCYHKNCSSAQALLERAMCSKKGADSKAELLSFKDKFPQEYKYKIMDLRTAVDGLTGNNKRRGSVQQEMVQSLIQEVKQFSRLSERQMVLLLGKAAFIQWFKREEGMEHDAAVAKWELDSKSPGTHKRYEHGVLKCAVRGHTALSSDQGVEQSSSYRTNQERLRDIPIWVLLHGDRVRLGQGCVVNV